jgi:hypothetical protein
MKPAIAYENVTRIRAMTILGNAFSIEMTVWAFILVLNIIINPIAIITKIIRKNTKFLNISHKFLNGDKAANPMPSAAFAWLIRPEDCRESRAQYTPEDGMYCIGITNTLVIDPIIVCSNPFWGLFGSLFQPCPIKKQPTKLT